MENYSVEIIEAGKELTPIETVAFKLSDDYTLLDNVETGQLIDVDYYVTLQVHNEKSDNKDYTKLIVIDKNGTKYSTSSQSFYNNFITIWNTLKDESNWQLKLVRGASKNYNGKEFLSCTVI